MKNTEHSATDLAVIILLAAVLGPAFIAKSTRDFSKQMPKKQKRLARDSAILAKLFSKNVVVIDGLSFEKPRTRDFVDILNNLKIDRSCLVAISSLDPHLYKSSQNIPRVAVIPVNELNAGEICRYSKMLFTKEAFLSILNKDQVSNN